MSRRRGVEAFSVEEEPTVTALEEVDTVDVLPLKADEAVTGWEEDDGGACDASDEDMAND